MNGSNTTKSFEPIHADHAFFDEHATESEADLRGYLLELRSLVQAAGPVRMLDFGCGAGGFSERFLTRAGLTGDRLALSLVEPDNEYRREAVGRLQALTSSPVRAWPSLPPDLQECFDLVLSNHALYYVVDLGETLARLLDALAPGGLFLTAIAGQDNPLLQMWKHGFALLDQPVPYFMAEDVDATLTRLGRSFRKQEVPYELVFPDTEENRLKVLRFLFAEHLEAIPRRDLLERFVPYAHDGCIDIRTTTVHFVTVKE